MAAEQAKPPTRNPVWSRDETILLLDLYLRAPNAEEGHPEVVSLSELLIARALSRGQSVQTNFRNPTGIAMKLKNLAQQDPVFLGTGRTGLSHGNALNAEVWAAFADDPDALSREVERIRGRAAAGAPGTAEPSRGPVPSFGVVRTGREDGPTELYIALMSGRASDLVPAARIQTSGSIVKIGRSNDTTRRCGELNLGFPPGSVAFWRMLFGFGFRSAGLAHDAEQALLQESARRGWTIGGEFAIAPLAVLLPLARATSYRLNAD